MISKTAGSFIYRCKNFTKKRKNIYVTFSVQNF